MTKPIESTPPLYGDDARRLRGPRQQPLVVMLVYTKEALQVYSIGKFDRHDAVDALRAGKPIAEALAKGTLTILAARVDAKAFSALEEKAYSDPTFTAFDTTVRYRPFDESAYANNPEDI